VHHSSSHSDQTSFCPVKRRFRKVRAKLMEIENNSVIHRVCRVQVVPKHSLLNRVYWIVKSTPSKERLLKPDASPRTKRALGVELAKQRVKDAAETRAITSKTFV